MASIQKRGKTYQYTISRMVNGESKPIRKGGFITKKEAQVAASEIEYQLSKGINLSTKKIAFDDYFENWIITYKFPTISQITYEHYKYSLKYVQTFFLGIALQDITKQKYQEFLNFIGKNKSKETVAKINGHIKSCVKDALDEQLIHSDFTRKSKLVYTIEAKSSSEKFLNYKDSKLLLQTIWSNIHNSLGYSFLLLALTSGMRYEELIGLTKNDFNFNECTISINKTWGYKKNSPSGFGPTKNINSNRTIKINAKTMNHFKELFVSIPPNDNQLVFFSASSKYQVLSNTAVNKLLKKLLVSLKLPTITVHGLRHTHGSVLIYMKSNIKYVSERLGHGDIETTLKVYTHVLKELRIEEEQHCSEVFEKMIG